VTPSYAIILKVTGGPAHLVRIQIPLRLMTQKISWKLIAGIIALYLVLAGTLAYTKRPWGDEAWFANISVNLMEHGKTGISVLDPLGNANRMGREIPGIDKEYCVWIPLQEAFNAVFYKVIGFSALKMRGISMCWGLCALVSWFVIALKLTDSMATAALTMFLIATDFVFLDAASDGRMDMMCASLAYGSLALYLLLRERYLERAILISQALAVAAGLTHPMGAIGFIALLFLTIYMDHSRLRWRHLGLALMAYLAGAVVIAAYILPNVPLFKAQLGAALTGRMDVVDSKTNTFLREFTVKYRILYLPPYASGAAKLRVLIPVIYGLGLLGALSMRSVRTSRRAMLGLAGVALVTVAFLDSGKLYYYLVHSTPYLAAVLAIWVSSLWTSGKLWFRGIAAGAVMALVFLQLAWLVMAARKDPYHKSFLPMAAFVQNRIEHGQSDHFLVMSSAELGFVTGFNRHLSDDALLGYQNGHYADLIIFDERSYDTHYEGFQKRRPEVAAHIRALLEKSGLVYTDGYYKVYATPGKSL
jgi:hypothetical protein